MDNPKSTEQLLQPLQSFVPPDSFDVHAHLYRGVDAIDSWPKYCRTSGKSMAAAVRIARASTRRDQVTFCGYHGWSNWYLAANIPSGTDTESPRGDQLQGHLLPGLEPAGVPRSLGGIALSFAYNRLDELRQTVKKHGNDFAAVVMEPFRNTEPETGFLKGVRALCDQCGAVLLSDEISSGWRFRLGRIVPKPGSRYRRSTKSADSDFWTWCIVAYWLRPSRISRTDNLANHSHVELWSTGRQRILSKFGAHRRACLCLQQCGRRDIRRTGRGNSSRQYHSTTAGCGKALRLC